MAEEFNKNEAKRKQDAIVRDALSPIVRDLKGNVVDYYWDKTPQSAEDERAARDYIRKALENAQRTISRVLQELQ